MVSRAIDVPIVGCGRPSTRSASASSGVLKPNRLDWKRQGRSWESFFSLLGSRFGSGTSTSAGAGD